MPNAFASLMLVLWPVISVWLFVRLTPGRALIASLLVAYLILPPPPAGFDFPLMPPLTKQTIPSFVAVLASIVIYRGRLKFLPENPVAKVLVILFIASPLFTVLTNMDPVYFGEYALPALRLREAVALMVQQALLISPMLLARNFLRTDSDLKDLLWAIFIGGMIYSLPILLEIRLSPQINIWVYGYFQHSFEQMIRQGGFRAIVFLYHGLWAAFLMMTTLLAAVTIARSDPSRRAVGWWVCAVYLLGVLVLSKSVASILYGFAFAPAIAFLTVRVQLHLAMVLVVLALAYPALKGADLVPEAQMLTAAERIDPDRANSLQFRLDNENVLFDRAMERPLFGWGSWGRNQIFNSAGEILTTTDGRWIITIGVFGWLGFLAEFGLLTLPIFLIWRRTTGVLRGTIPPFLGGVALILAVNVLDLLPNATITPMTWLFAGALLGYSEQAQLARRARPAPLQTVL
jgi:hypothetical protein